MNGGEHREEPQQLSKKQNLLEMLAPSPGEKLTSRHTSGAVNIEGKLTLFQIAKAWNKGDER